jgi:hypothetical protein
MGGGKEAEKTRGTHYSGRATTKRANSWGQGEKGRGKGELGFGLFAHGRGNPRPQGSKGLAQGSCPQGSAPKGLPRANRRAGGQAGRRREKHYFRPVGFSLSALLVPICTAGVQLLTTLTAHK